MATNAPLSDVFSTTLQNPLPLKGPVMDALESYKKKDTSKGELKSQRFVVNPTDIVCVVVVRFKAVGNAPIMKQNFYKITAANRFQAVIQFLRKELGWKSTDPLVRPYI